VEARQKNGGKTALLAVGLGAMLVAGAYFAATAGGGPSVERIRGEDM
jgi:hypothetical protein